MAARVERRGQRGGALATKCARRNKNDRASTTDPCVAQRTPQKQEEENKRKEEAAAAAAAKKAEAAQVQAEFPSLGELASFALSLCLRRDRAAGSNSASLYADKPVYHLHHHHHHHLSLLRMSHD